MTCGQDSCSTVTCCGSRCRLSVKLRKKTGLKWTQSRFSRICAQKWETSQRHQSKIYAFQHCARHIVPGRIIYKRKENNDDSGREHSVDSGQSGRTVRPRSSSVLRSPELSTADLQYYSSSPLCVESVLLVRRS